MYSSVRAVMRSVTQLIPARGRKLIPKKDGGGKLATQLIPARGRKPGHWVCVSWCCIDTTYPREGTETWAGARGTTTTARHNLSPRGDGNRIVQTGDLNGFDTTYPREGTETMASPGIVVAYSDTTYPREGTETLSGR